MCVPLLAQTDSFAVAERCDPTSSSSTPPVNTFPTDNLDSLGYGVQSRGSNFAARLAARDGLKEQFRGEYSRRWLPSALRRQDGEAYVLALTGRALTLDMIENDEIDTVHTEGTHIIPECFGDSKPSVIYPSCTYSALQISNPIQNSLKGSVYICGRVCI